MLNSLELIRDLISIPAPPGEEARVIRSLAPKLIAMGYAPEIDAKGNLLVEVGESRDETDAPAILVTAHMDEIGLIVTGIDEDGKVRVAAMGGTYAWKWGEGAVEILTFSGESITAILSYGSIHTNHPDSVAEFARHNPLTFKQAFLFTGKTKAQLTEAGVVPGVRVALSPSRRVVTEIGDFVASYFLDDRADLAVWLMALERLKDKKLSVPVTFAATTYEEVGGEGARYILNGENYDICVALEIGPKTPENTFEIDSTPTIWVQDGYASLDPQDGRILMEVCTQLGYAPHWHFLSRGGSDASCASALGQVARPVTLAFPTENSHGYEIIHKDAPERLTELLLAYLERVSQF